MPKTKILCMHGYGTNAHFMKKQSVSMQKLLQKEVEFIFVDAPYPAPQHFVVDQKVIDLIEGQHRSWFPKVNMTEFKQTFMQELQKIRIVFEKASDHYDGMLGFSQGAVTIHFLLKLKEIGLIQWKILQGIKFTINMNSNHHCYSLFNNEDKQIQTPSFHILSPEDFIYAKSILHTTQFRDPIVISHSYGHKFPKLGLSESKLLISFIRKYSGTSQKKKQEFEVLSLSSL